MFKPTPAGKFNRRIELQSDKGAKRDSDGSVIADWQTYAKRWASIEPLTGRELLAMQQVAAEVSHLIKLRYDGQLAEKLSRKHRVKLGSRTWDINSVIDPEEAHVELHLTCKEAV